MTQTWQRVLDSKEIAAAVVYIKKGTAGAVAYITKVLQEKEFLNVGDFVAIQKQVIKHRTVDIYYLFYENRNDYAKDC